MERVQNVEMESKNVFSSFFKLSSLAFYITAINCYRCMCSLLFLSHNGPNRLQLDVVRSAAIKRIRT